MASLLSLPVQDVLVLHILPRLSLIEIWKLRVVCKSMYEAVYQFIRCMVTKLEVESSQWQSLYPSLEVILRNSARLQHLFINNNASSNCIYHDLSIERSLASLFLSKPLLSVLKLHGVTFHMKSTVLTLADVSVNLKTLHLFRVRGFNDCLDVLLKNTTSLEEFVCYGTDISRSFVVAIIKQTQLSTLEVSTNNLHTQILLVLILNEMASLFFFFTCSLVIA